MGPAVCLPVAERARPPPCEGICIGGDFSDIAFAGPSLIFSLPHFEDVGGPGDFFEEAAQEENQCPNEAAPSPQFMHFTTNQALMSVPGGGQSGPLTSEFSRITMLPNLTTGGWVQTGSSHADFAFEHGLPGSDKVVKVYIGDNNFGGFTTVTITAPTKSVEHYVDFIPYVLGSNVNTDNANDYQQDIAGC